MSGTQVPAGTYIIFSEDFNDNTSQTLCATYQGPGLPVIVTPMANNTNQQWILSTISPTTQVLTPVSNSSVVAMPEYEPNIGPLAGGLFTTPPAQYSPGTDQWLTVQAEGGAYIQFNGYPTSLPIFWDLATPTAGLQIQLVQKELGEYSATRWFFFPV